MAMRKVVASLDALWKVFAEIGHSHGDEFSKPLMVTIEEWKPPRSLPQNARLHCMIRALSDFTGHSESELKEWFKAEYGPTKRLQVGKTGRIIPLSTTLYTRKQMAELIDHVDRVCAENGVYVEENHEPA